MSNGSRLNALWGLTIVLFLGSMVHSAFVDRELLADGCQAMVVKLENIDHPSWSGFRGRAYMLIQWPLELALRAGVRDLATCRAFHAAGMLYITPLAVGLGLLVARGDPILQLLVLLYLGGIFACFDLPIHMEAVPAIALVMLASVLLLRRGEVGWAQAGAVLALALPLANCYELVVLSLAFLAWLCVVRLRSGDARGRLAQGLLALAAATFVVGAGFALDELLYVRHPGLMDAGVGALKTFDWVSPGVVYVAAVALLFVLARVPGRWGTLAAGLFVAASAAYALLPVVAPWWLFPSRFFHARLLTTLPLLLLLLAACGLSRGTLAVRREDLSRALVVALVVVCVQSVFRFGANFRWSQYLDSYAAALTRHEGLIPFAELGPEVRWGRTFAWPWTHPTLSILLSPRGEVRTIACSEGLSWRPFAPERVDQLPALQAFGVDYSRYAAALARCASTGR